MLPCVFTPRPVGPEGVLSSPLCAIFAAAARTFFGYYTNMVQQIKFIQTFNPSWHFFLRKVIDRGVLKILVNAITSKIIIFFRLIIFFIIPLKPGIYRFSSSASLLALSFFTCNRKGGYGGHLYFLITKFLINAIT